MDGIFKTIINILRKALDHLSKASVNRNQTMFFDVYNFIDECSNFSRRG